MPVTTISSREFARDTRRAKAAAAGGPVLITDRGRPVYAFMAIDDYNRLAGQEKSLAEMLAHADSAGVEFEPPRLDGKSLRSPDLG